MPHWVMELRFLVDCIRLHLDLRCCCEEMGTEEECQSSLLGLGKN